MVENVYFVDLRSRSDLENKGNKIVNIFQRAGFADLFGENDNTAIKVHFGERGNDSYVSPVMIRYIVDKIKETGSKIFVTDTNTLYYGSRHDSTSHLETAILNGFDYSVVGAPLIIADGLFSNNERIVNINQKHFEKVKIAGDIYDSTAMMVVSHFKGHGMSGFGGALKNLAMGCATISGKLEQHESAKPVVGENCIGCGICINSCPVDCMSMEARENIKKSKNPDLKSNYEDNQIDNDSYTQKSVIASIDYESCIACMNCFDACKNEAIDLDWDNDIPVFIEKMMEYALGATKGKVNKIAYINFLINITPDCDCVPWSDVPVVPDIGILASKDPVALDSASYDLVNEQIGIKGSLLDKNFNKGEDKFKGVWEEVDGKNQLEYAEKLGIGIRKYKLVKI